jgi:hypothetical protein
MLTSPPPRRVRLHPKTGARAVRVAVGWWLGLTVVVSVFFGKPAWLALFGDDATGTITTVVSDRRSRNPGQNLTVVVTHEGQAHSVRIHRSARGLVLGEQATEGSPIDVRIDEVFGVAFADESVWLWGLVWLLGVVGAFSITFGAVLLEYVVLRIGRLATTTEIHRAPSGPARYRFVVDGAVVQSSKWVLHEPPSSFTGQLRVMYVPGWPQVSCLPDFAVWQAAD